MHLASLIGRNSRSRRWRRRLALGVATIAIVSLNTAAGYSRQPQRLVFDDEFNGTTLDATKWAPNWFGDGSVQNNTVMESSNVSVSGGYLHLQLTSTSGALVSTDPIGGADPGYQFTYGTVETRAYLPGTRSVSNWPAIWTVGQVWPTDGEMDIVEGLDGQACFHFHDSSGGPGKCVSGNYSGWHTFDATWSPGVVTYSYDGVEVGSISRGITNQPMFIVLENSNPYNGAAPIPSTMLVDYVRVYQ